MRKKTTTYAMSTYKRDLTVLDGTIKNIEKEIRNLNIKIQTLTKSRNALREDWREAIIEYKKEMLDNDLA
tara:strand:+ start:103 stop:312 length:210 start_codon:yes stop_codon:yes gene_type:complete